MSSIFVDPFGINGTDRTSLPTSTGGSAGTTELGSPGGTNAVIGTGPWFDEVGGCGQITSGNVLQITTQGFDQKAGAVNPATGQNFQAFCLTQPITASVGGVLSDYYRFRHVAGGTAAYACYLNLLTGTNAAQIIPTVSSSPSGAQGAGTHSPLFSGSGFFQAPSGAHQYLITASFLSNGGSTATTVTYSVYQADLVTIDWVNGSVTGSALATLTKSDSTGPQGAGNYLVAVNRLSGTGSAEIATYTYGGPLAAGTSSLTIAATNESNPQIGTPLLPASANVAISGITGGTAPYTNQCQVSTDNSTWTNSGSTATGATATVTATGLTLGGTYYFRVQTIDSAGSPATVNSASIGPYKLPRTLIVPGGDSLTFGVPYSQISITSGSSYPMQLGALRGSTGAVAIDNVLMGVWNTGIGATTTAYWLPSGTNGIARVIAQYNASYDHNIAVLWLGTNDNVNNAESAPLFAGSGVFSAPATTGGFLQSGQTYYYLVSSFVNGVETVGFEQSYTVPTNGLSTNKITINWIPSISGNVTSPFQRVYRGTTSGGELMISSGLSNATTSFADTVQTPSGSPPATKMLTASVFASTIWANLTTLIGLCKSAGFDKIFVGTIWPRNPSGISGTVGTPSTNATDIFFEACRIALNTAIRNGWASAGASSVIDFGGQGQVGYNTAQFNATYIQSSDLTHGTIASYGINAAMVEQAILASLTPQPSGGGGGGGGSGGIFVQG